MLNANMIIEKSFEQGSPEWHEARIDSLGGTGIEKIITNAKWERSESRSGYLEEKAQDIISRDPKPTFEKWEMKWGHKYEPAALDTLSFVKGIELDTCAMIFSDESRTWHISPDAFNDYERFGVEAKCYQLKAFRKCKKDNKLPTKHILQIQSGLALTGWDYWWFIAYFPNLTPFITKVERDEPLIKIIKAEVKIFLRDLNNFIEEAKK